jgi:hypothetical protein
MLNRKNEIAVHLILSTMNYLSKRNLSLFSLLLISGFFNLLLGQALTGTKTVCSSGCDYATVSLAVSALNGNGVGAGGVIFNVSADHVERLTASVIITASGTASDPIVFQKNGTGANPILTAYVGTTTSDAPVKIRGGDYITIDGIDVKDTSLNTTTNQQMEWGYALVKFQNTAPFNGCQNVTIKNCTVTLNKANTASKGIYIGNNIATATAALTITAASDAHSNIKIYGNKITNCYAGIYANGFNQPTGPYTLYDQNLDIGGSSVATANTITNFGGATTGYGIYLSSQNNANIAYNTINNLADGGVVASSATHGIYALNGVTSDITYKQNTISLTGSNTLYSIRSDVGGNILIDGNTMKDSITSGATVIYMVFTNFTAPASMTVTGNTVSNCSFNGTGTTYGFYIENIDGNLTVSGNTITDISRTSASGIFTAYSIGSGSALNGTANILNNTFKNFAYTGSGSVNVFLIKGYSIHNISGNIVRDCSTGTGLFYPIYVATDGVISNVYNNKVSNITTSGTLYGIYYYAQNIKGGQIFNNTVTGLTTSSALVKGIYVHFPVAASTGFFKVYNNTVSDITTNNSTVTSSSEGININGASTSADTVQLYNNVIANIKAPSSINPTAVAGLNVPSISTLGQVSAWYNTIYLTGTSSGLGFGSSGIFTTTVALFASANNIVINNTVPTGVGKAVAYRRSTAATGTYDPQSDNNIFYCGATPSSSNVIFYDGISVDSLLSDYQSRMTPREVASMRENVLFISTTAGSPNLLQPDSTIGTFIESAGKNITGITTDLTGKIRAGNPGYSGTGTNPDIGAYEGNLTPKQMVYDSSVADQVTELAARKPLQAVLRIRVYMENPFNPLSLTSLRLSTTGTTSITDLDSAKIYFTGSNNFFYPGTSFGSTILSPSGAMQFNGNVMLTAGVSYFWLVYDVKAGATPGNIIDAKLDSILIGGVYHIPVNGNPVGGRMISTPIAGGIYEVGPGLDYTTLADAVTAVNERGVAGAVTINLSPGFIERAPVGGYRLGSATLNATLSVSNTLTFQKKTSGTNPLIYANEGSSINADGIFIIQGADYVTIDQIDLIDTNTIGNKMEWGYAMLKRQSVAPFDGCQFVSIKNCTVTMQRANTNSKGIYVSNHTANAVGFKPDLVSTFDAHNNNKIYGNTITGAYISVHVEGSNGSAFYDQNNEVGGNAASTGNTLSNFGGAAITAYGVYGIYQNNLRIAHNIIDNTANGGVGHLSVMYGVFHGTGENSDLTVDSNQITLTMGASGTSAIYSIASFVTGNLTIHKNTLRDSTLAAIGGAINFIYNLTNCASETITGNTIYNSTLNATGAIYVGNLSNLTPNVVIGDNIISNVKRTGANGTHFGFYSFIGDTSPGTATIYNNIFTNLQNAGVGTWYAIYWGSCAVQNVYGNTITNITSGGGNLHPISVLEYGRIARIYNNTISNINTGGNFNGIIFNGTHYTSGVLYNNIIQDVNSTGGTASKGLFIQFSGEGFTGTYDIYRNKIKGITTTASTSSVIDGIYLTAASGNTLTVNVHNNIIGNVSAVNSTSPTAMSGININSTGMNVNLYYNTIYLTGAGATSTFGSSGIYAHTGSVLTVSNNIVVNNSTPGVSGKVVAFRRSSATLTSYAALSNNNIWFAGLTPTVNNAIFYDGTSTDNTFALFRTRVAPRDSLSGTENTQFISTINSSDYFLRLDSTVLTFAESGGRQIAGITTDINGTVRQGNVGYTGTGAATDIGAFEGELTGSPMVLDSAVITQITGPIAKGSANQLLLKIAMYTNNALHPFVLERFKLSTNGTGVPLDIANAKVFSTGSSPAFSTASQYGTTVVAPNGIYYVTGTKTLEVGVNYFWLTYDITSSAGIGNLIDATVDSMLMSGANYTSLNGDPVGSREVKAVMSGVYPIGAGNLYTTLTPAISDLIAIGVNGPVVLELQDLYDPATETFPVIIPAIAGVNNTNTITIRPSSSTTVTLSASVPTSLFILDGADYITLSGMQGGTGAPKSMIIYNTHTDGNDVLFRNDATNNKLKHLECKGVNISATGGLIRFSTGITSGNDHNLIDSCDLHDGTSMPSAIVYALGSTATTTMYNSNNIISNCNIYNFWNIFGESAGISLANGNTDWTLSDNHFYQTNALSAFGTFTQYAMNLNNGGNNNALNNMQISGNYIGGSAPMATGTAWTLSGTSQAKFTGCLLNLGSIAASGFRNNTISNFNWATGNTTTAYPGVWSAAYCSAGVMDVSNNIIGSTNSIDNIIVTSSAASSTVMGIATSNLAAGNMSFSGNYFGGIKTSGTTGTVSTSLTLLGFSSSTSATHFRVDSNIFGNDIADNVVAFNPASSAIQSVIGIQHGGTSHINVRNNVLRNFRNYFQGTGAGVLNGIAIDSSGTDTLTGNLLTNFISNAANTNQEASASIVGIQMASSSGGNLVSKNVLKNFMNTHPTAANAIHGINTNNTISLVISSNTINGFNSLSNSSSSKITGINFQGGASRTVNNMVSLGYDSTGLPINNTLNLVGLNKSAAGSLSLYFNTVVIDGYTSISGTASTYACNRGGIGNDTIMNNIFVNLRTNNNIDGGSHFAIGGIGTLTLKQDYNLLYVALVPGDTLAQLGTTAYYTLPAWSNATGLDLHSRSKNVSFVSSTDLHLMNPSIGDTALACVPVAGVSKDFDGDNRDAFKPYKGADENTSAPLPVKLISFSGMNEKGDVKLEWITASESHNAGFTIQRLAEGKIFKDLNFVKTKGNSSILQVYNYTDANAFSMAGTAILYYRLKQTDDNGTVSYSEVISVKQDQKNTEEEIVVLPNPFNERLIITYPGNENETPHVTVTDIQGRTVQKGEASVLSAGHSFSIEINEEIKSGIYFVKVTSNGISTVYKRIKE